MSVKASELIQLLPKRVRIVEKIKETPDTYSITLKHLEEKAFPEFMPGQFAMLYRFGAGEVPISISSDPADTRRITFTVRGIGWVTNALVSSRVGDVLGFRGPYGSHWPVDEAEGKDVVIVAGGLGLAPLRPVIYHIIANREKFGEVHVLYGARTPKDLLYRREFRSWSRKLNLLLTVDKGDSRWKKHVGVVTTLFKYVELDPEKTIAMVCGPEIMMRFTIMELQKRNISSDKIYISMERHMKCGVRVCGKCQFGPYFICRDGPVFRFDKIERYFWVKEV